MELYKQNLQIDLPYPMEQLFTSQNTYKKEDFLFFDIETTGLSADVSNLYLIGCLYYENEEFHMKQWFADSYDSETALIQAFFEELKNHKVLLHYNGNGFDIPYLQKKIAAFELPYSFDCIESIDLYKAIRPYKKILQLPNLKQKTIEAFLNIGREDEYNGKELIPVYGEYMKKKFCREDNSKELSLLLLHNDEDLKGMVELLSLCYYIDLFKKKHKILSVGLKDSIVTAVLSLEHALENQVKYHNEGLSFETIGNELHINLLLHQGELKYFYPNYKDYYYLPAEDMAVHKSVAEYVDKEFREKAKKSNCYIKKTGLFLPVDEEMAKEINTMVFRTDASSKQGFMEISESWLTNLEHQDLLEDYLHMLICNLK
ncbi:MAG: ribonuclease H-like domain-containing protein [bacterium]|nr:ribonuclease H-like domain-containing protein [bacterium]